jgi:hypothetical protein
LWVLANQQCDRAAGGLEVRVHGGIAAVVQEALAD